MNNEDISLITALIMFLSIVYINIARKNSAIIVSYTLQSIALAGLLINEALNESSFEKWLLVFIILLVKVIITPQIFWRFLQNQKQNFSDVKYLNTPLTLFMLILITFFAQSPFLSPLTNVLFHNQLPVVSTLLISSIIMSFFIAINRKGAFSQIIGILSLENAIFAFGIFLETKQSISLEIGIIFDVLLWVIISSFYIKTIYSHFKSLDVTKLKELSR